MEMIMIVIVVMILIWVGIVFYSKFKTQGDTGKLREYRELDMLELAAAVSSMPELGCSFAQAKEVSCFDKYKLDVFKTQIDLVQAGTIDSPGSFNYYYDQLGNSKILLRYVFPDDGIPENDELLLYDNPSTSDTQGSESLKIPVVIHEPIEDVFSFAVLEISYYYAAG